MPSGTEEYRCYIIYWDTIGPTDQNAWRAKAGIIAPPDSTGDSDPIVGISGDRFQSESEARDYVLRAAKKHVDEIIDGPLETLKRIDSVPLMYRFAFSFGCGR
jgi:hypothetical protein